MQWQLASLVMSNVASMTTGEAVHALPVSTYVMLAVPLHALFVTTVSDWDAEPAGASSLAVSGV